MATQGKTLTADGAVFAVVWTWLLMERTGKVGSGRKGMGWRDTGWGRRPAARSTDVLKVGYKKQLSAGQPMHLMWSSCSSASCVRGGPLSTGYTRQLIAQIFQVSRLLARWLCEKNAFALADVMLAARW